tara:strand:- start:15867 stop:16289 length:423 start_codon:yes stop_codon:yes gene_type:complete
MDDYKFIKFDWRELEQFGINALTGEANGIIGMQRLLCDVTIEGQRVLAEFFGMCMQGMPENWNSGSIGSIMLPGSILQDLIIFCYLQNYNAVYILKCNHGEYHVASNDIDAVLNEHQYLEQEGMICGKNRNTHAMSGRTI